MIRPKEILMVESQPGRLLKPSRTIGFVPYAERVRRISSLRTEISSFADPLVSATFHCRFYSRK